MADPRLGAEDRDDRRAIAVSAAAIYAGAAAIGLVEGLIPGGQAFSLAPAIGALVLAAVTALLGPRLRRRELVVLGPLGVTLIAATLATTVGHSDAAIFYTWPVLWMAYFYGTRGTAFMVVWIAACHGVALWAMPAGVANLDRWIDVVAAVIVVGVVIQSLAARNARLVARLEAEARVDPLTGLLNRRGFEERAAELATREGGLLAVVVFDVDHFKVVNDRYGHDQGDNVLRWVGAVLLGESRGIDVVARMGGEEFIVLLPRTDAHEAQTFSERARQAISAAEGRASHGVLDDLALSISAGVASASAPVELDALAAAADTALYEAKRSGRDRTCLAALAA